MSNRQMTLIRNVAAHGTGGMVQFHKEELRAISADVGLPVRVTIEAVDNNYETTAEAAKRMRGRFGRTLELLTK
ncbi:MAG: hypothetical protein AAGD23_02450 [Pseudomonadota bacterium]